MQTVSKGYIWCGPMCKYMLYKAQLLIERQNIWMWWIRLHNLSFSLWLTHWLTDSLTHSLTLTHPPHPLTHSLTHSFCVFSIKDLTNVFSLNSTHINPPPTHHSPTHTHTHPASHPYTRTFVPRQRRGHLGCPSSQWAFHHGFGGRTWYRCYYRPARMWIAGGQQH